MRICRLLKSLVKEYNIRVAIHNHGPGDKNFPTPQSVLDAVKGLDPRVGFCIDIGHATLSGVDVPRRPSRPLGRVCSKRILEILTQIKPRFPWVTA